jgi:hypothetical protein
MRKFYFTLLISILVQTTIFSQTAPISFSLPTTKFCPGQIFPISFTNDPSLDGHTFQVQLSNSSGSFSSGVSILGSGTSKPISCTMVGTTTLSTSLYKIRIIDNTSPNNISNESITITIISLSTLSTSLDAVGNFVQNVTLCTSSNNTRSPLRLYANHRFHNSYGTTYEWKNTLNPSVILGSDSTFIVNTQGNYTVNISKSGCGNKTSGVSIVNYATQISGSIQFPGDKHCTGSIIRIKTPYYTETATYQWKKDGTDIFQATSSAFDATVSGIYTVKVVDLTCNSTIGVGLTFSKSISAQIDSATDTISICNGSEYPFLASYPLIANNKIQWYVNGDSLTSMNDFAANRFFYASSQGAYTFKLKEGDCAVFSNPIYLKLVTSLKPIVNKNTENTTCLTSTTLSTSVPGFFSGQYQWKNNGVDIAGATSQTYNTSATVSGLYSLKLTQGLCSGESEPIPITVVNNNPTYSIISERKLCETTEILSISPNISVTGQFQWLKDNQLISGATLNTYNALSAGTYKLRVTKNSCVGYSQDIIVNSSGGLGKPVISFGSYNFDGIGASKPYQCTGNISTIILKNNLTNYSRIWKKDGVPIISSGIPSSLQITESGTYQLDFTSPCVISSNTLKINIGDKQQSIGTNNWNDPSSWACGTIPIVTDEVIINKGHTISLPDNYTGFLKNLELNGVLQKGNNAQLKFQTN